MSSSTVFWYASRATGIVALLLLTAVLVLGILVNRQGRLPGLPKFAVTNLHRNLSLLSVAFIAVHVLTAVLDTFLESGPAMGVTELAGRLGLAKSVVHRLVTALVEAGYLSLPIEGVAASAQPGEAVLYRRWPGRDIVLSCSAPTRTPCPTLADRVK